MIPDSSKDAEGYSVTSTVSGNLLRTASGAALSLGLPLALAAVLDRRSYSVWAFAFSVSGYIAYFDLGTASNVAAFVSGRHPSYVRAVTRYATRLLALVSFPLGLLVWIVGTSIVASPSTAKGAPNPNPWELVGLLTIGNLFLLLTAVPIGVGLATGRAARISIGVTVGRIIIAISVLVVALRQDTLAILAMAFAIGTLATAGIAFGLIQPRLPLERLSTDDSAALARRFRRQAFGLARWSLTMFLVSGLDTLLVGVFNFKDVGAYAVALALATALVTGSNAVLSARLPLWAAPGQESASLCAAIVWAFRKNLCVVLAAASFEIVAFHFAALLSGSPTFLQAQRFVLVLVAANATRQVGAPIALALIAAHKSREAFGAPLTEALINVICSLSLGWLLGPIGVALGTLIGAFCGLFVLATKASPRYLGIRHRDLFGSFGAPASIFVAAIACLTAVGWISKSQLVSICVVILVSLAGLPFGLSLLGLNQLPASMSLMPRGLSGVIVARARRGRRQ